ncbi:hypothetical protein IAT40_000793 [Kwoniella sp. CBS 6097]
MAPLARSIVSLLSLDVALSYFEPEQQTFGTYDQTINGDSGYSLARKYIGQDFFDGFDFKTMEDPTHGRVNYVSKQQAHEKGLAYIDEGNTFVMKVDDKYTVSHGQRGRDSIRIESQEDFGNGVIILDVLHMPTGCATWPAFWTLGAGNWPNGGEIDILEGVNGIGTNQATLHTSSGCTMPNHINATGTQLDTNCAINTNEDHGCGVRDNRRESFGATFNREKGGWLAMQRSNDGISMWFWPRYNSLVPEDVRSGEQKVNPANWGKPFAAFPSTHCSISNHFDQHKIIFSTSLCGDWAGATYSQSGCPGTCESHVDGYPGAFQYAYWKLNALRVYH